MANYNLTYKIDVSGNFKEIDNTAKSINRNMKEAASSSSKLGKAASGALNATRGARPAMDEREYERARGVTGKTGASGRDFAKQAEGLGGLVRLYATFAANIFAVSQAFEVLKRSYQFEQLQKASEAFAVSTGKNLTGVAKELRMLSDGALTAKAAQQFANYGQSAGFTADQMRRLIGVARGASQALGRDFGDAIDRLIRGTGKLEPELLDEIGLLTRTKTAGEAYAKSLGKTFEQLTQFEKVQAFTNAVIEEGERKFSAVSKAVPVSAFERFSAAAIDAGTAVSNFVNKAIVPLLDVLASNPALIIAGLIATIAKLASTALPFINNLAAKARQAAADQAKYASDKEQEALKAYQSVARAKQTEIMHGANAAKIAVDRFVEGESKKIAAIQRTAVAMIASRKGDSNLGLDALKNMNGGNLVETQKAVDAAIRKQLGNIKGLNTLQSQGVAINTKKLATHRQSLALLEQEKLKIEELIKQQAVLNRLKAIQVQQEKAAAAVMAKQSAQAQSQASAEALRSKRANAIYQAVNVAQQPKAGLGVTAAFKTLNNELGEISKSTKAANAEIIKAGGSVSRYSTMSFAAGQATAYFTGSVKILGTALVGIATKLAGALGVLSILYFVIDGIISVAGGYSDKIEAAKEATENLTKSNEIAIKQAVEYNKQLLESDGSLQGFTRTMEYSANAIGAISDNLSVAAKSMLEFETSSGAVSKGWQAVLSVFGKDLATKFGENFKNSLYSSLSLSSGQDKEKITQAILKLFPEAKTIEEAVIQFDGLNAASKAFRAAEVSKEIAKINAEMKSSAANLKAASDGWTKVGDALDSYNKKAEVKDPKLKDIVNALSSVQAAYAAATTEQEKALVLSGITVERQAELNKLAKERGIDLSGVNRLIDEGRVKTQQALEVQKQQAQVQKDMALSAAQSAIDTFKMYDQTASTKLKETQASYLELVRTAKNNQLVDPSQITALKGMLVKTSSELIVELEKLAAKSTGTQAEGLRIMIEQLRSEVPMITALVESGLSSGVTRAFANITPTLMAEFNKFRNMENKGDKDRGASATPEQLEAAKKANDPLAKAASDFARSNKQAEASAKVARTYDLRVKLAQQELEILKQQAGIQQQAVGYVSSAMSNKLEAAQALVIERQYEKEIQEILKNKAKLSGDQKEFIKAQLNEEKLSKQIAEDTRKIALEALRIETERTAIQREKVKFEKEIYDFQKMSLDMNSQMLEISRSMNLVDDVGAATIQAQISFEKEALDIQRKRVDLIAKEKALAKGLAGDGETTQTIAAERQLLDFMEQRAELTRLQVIEQAKYNQYVEDAGAALDSVTDNLSRQLDFTIAISTEAENQARQLDQINLLATNILIEFEKLPKSQQNAINAENMLLAAAQQVLETKQQIYDLNAKMNSGADFGETVKQGLEVAALDFAKTSKSLARSTVDGMVGAIDATVDALFDKVKEGGKISMKELFKVGTDFIKNAMLDFVSQSIKQSLRDSLAGLFGGESAEQQQKRAVQAMTDALKNNAKAHTEATKPMLQLKDALASLEQTIKNWQPTSGSGGGSPISSTTAALFGPLDTYATQLIDASKQTNAFGDMLTMGTKATQTFGKINVWAGNEVAGLAESAATAAENIAKLATTGAGGGAGSIGNLMSSLGSLFGGLPGMGGNSLSTTLTSMLSGRSGELAAGFVGPPTALANPGVAGSAAGMMGSMIGGASTGAAIGGISASLFGNERNSKYMELGGTIGGIAGAVLTPILGPLGPIIGAALGSALGSLFKSGGGPKSGGFAQSGEGFDRFYTPSDKDSELSSQVKSISSSYDSIIGKLGGKGSAQFGLGFDTDPKGTAQSRVTSGVIVNGKEIISTIEAGRTAEELSTAIEEASKRLVLTAIKNSDLPANVAAYYAGISDEAIKEMDSETIEKKLDFGTILGAISKARDRVAEIFGEDLYNLTEAQLGPFNKQGEKLSETFARLSAEFTVTNRVTKFLGVSTKNAFGAVGLASAEMREELIEGAGGLEAFSSQFTYFMENFYSEIEVASFEFASAGEALRNGFDGLSISIPYTMAGYRQAVTDALNSGNLELYNSLMELAPAFNTVVGAIERVNASIAGMAGNFLDQIAADTQTAEQRYTTFRGRANEAQASIDEIMTMTPEALIAAVQAGTITPAQIEGLASSAIENASAAWSLLDENQRRILGPEFTRFTTNLTTNVSAVLEAINAAIMAGPKPEAGKPAGALTPPPVTTSETVTPPSAEDILKVPERTGTAIVEALTSGAEVVNTKIMEAFNSVNLLDGSNPTGAGPLGTTPDQLETQRIREEAAFLAKTQLQEAERVNQENHAAALAAMADKVLGAANGMLEAAAHMQAAATTPQQVNVTVQTLDDNVAAEVGV